MKRLVCLFLALVMLQTTLINVFADETAREEFVVDISMLSRKQIDNIPQNFKKLDLKGLMTRDIKDEVEGDGKGGWSDQGENDLRMFDKFGAQTIQGIPFDFVNPAQNNGKAVLALRGQDDMELPTSVDVPVNTKTAGAYFVHASPWCSDICGTYSWVYADGTEAYVNVEKDVYICDFWGYNSFDYCRPAWTTTKSDGSKRSLYLFAMNNPHPEKEVKCLRLSTTGSGAYIMVMAITLTDSGPYLEMVESAKYRTVSTYGWFPHQSTTVEKREDGVLDFSHLLDAPAGKHGKVVAEGSGFMFEDGTAARFYGVDIIGTANFPEKFQAAAIAKEIAMDGVNLVRMKEFDSLIYGNKKSHSSFDGDMSDKFMNFISQLKKNGIYVYLSVFSDFQLYESDGVENYQDFHTGLGFDGFWDEDLLKVQKNHLRLLMNEKNQYTGMTLLEDPAVAFVEFADSKSVTDFTTGWGINSLANNEQQKKLNVLFNGFLRNRYKTTKEFEAKWNLYDKKAEETIEEGNMIAEPSWKSSLHSEAYKSDMADFLIGLEEGYYKEMCSEVPGKLSTSNTNKVNKYSPYELKASGKTDFTARNSVYAEILNKSDKLSDYTTFVEYKSPVISASDSTALRMTKNTLYNQPFVCGYGAGLPNLYFSAEQVMVTSFAAQNNWLPIQYSYANGDYDKSVIDDAYSIIDSPVKKALLPIMATVYHSMKPLAETRLEVTAGKEAPVTSKDAYTKNIRIASIDTEIGAKTEVRNAIVFKNNNIYWDSEVGIFEVRTPKAEAMTGYFEEKEEMPSFVIDTDNMYITAALTSATDKEIKDSETLIFTALCGNQNTGNSVNIIKNNFTSLGTAPVIVQGIAGKVVLKVKGNFDVWALDSDGQRTAKLDTKKNADGYIEFDISPDYKAIQYEIRRK